MPPPPPADEPWEPWEGDLIPLVGETTGSAKYDPTLWQGVLAEVSGAVGERWTKNVYPLGVVDGALVVVVPSAEHAKRLHEGAGALLAKAAGGGLVAYRMSSYQKAVTIADVRQSSDRYRGDLELLSDRIALALGSLDDLPPVPPLPEGARPWGKAGRERADAIAGRAEARRHVTSAKLQWALAHDALDDDPASFVAAFERTRVEVEAAERLVGEAASVHP